MNNIVNYLKSKGCVFKKGTGGWFMTTCVFCQGVNDLAVKEENGVFSCFKCNAVGNIWKMKKHFGELPVYEAMDKQEVIKSMPTDKVDVYRKALTKNINAWNYLRRERGFNKEVIAKFKLGFEDGFITIPYYYGGNLVNIKYKKPNSSDYRRETGQPSTLYNIDVIDKTLPITIVEGECDCMAAYQLGYKNVISVPNGAGGIQEDWIDFFDGCSGNVYIAYDNDAPGEKGARSLAKRIGFERCFRVVLPLKDFNDTLMGGYTQDDITPYFTKAQQYTPPAFTHMEGLKDKLDDFFMKGEDERKGLQLPEWSLFNKKIGGLRETEITVVSGETGSGKSTFVTNVFNKLLITDQKVLIVSSEVPAVKVLTKLFAIYIGKPFHKFNQEEYTKAYDFYVTKELYFIDIHGKISIDELSDYITYGNRKYDIKFVMLDHLHFFIDAGADNTVQLIENFMRKLVCVTLKTAVHVFLIAHPAKLKNDGGYVNVNDLRGSCVVGDTLVGCKKIVNIVEGRQYFPVSSFDIKNDKKRKITPEHLINSGMLPCYKITTSLGKSITISAETKLYTSNGWIKAKNLTTTDKLLYKTNFREGTNNPMLNHVSWNRGKKGLFKHTEATKKLISKNIRRYRQTKRHKENVGNALRNKHGYKIAGGYAFIYVPEYRNAVKKAPDKGYMLEHRYLMEQYLGRDLLKIEVIHHIDGNKVNNKIENLLLCSSNRFHQNIHIEMQAFMFKLLREGKVYYDKVEKKFKVR